MIKYVVLMVMNNDGSKYTWYIGEEIELNIQYQMCCNLCECVCGARLNHFPVTNDINLMLNNVSNRCGVAYCCILIVIIIIDNSFID